MNLPEIKPEYCMVCLRKLTDHNVRNISLIEESIIRWERELTKYADDASKTEFITDRLKFIRGRKLHFEEVMATLNKG